LAKSNLLDISGIDVLDAIGVLEVQFELVDDKALDLIGTHADVIEKDVDFGDIGGGKISTRILV
jgi:hypothetical protein